MPRPRLRPAPGFVLPATLWMIAVIALVFLAMADWVSGSVATARQLQQLAAEEVVAYSLEQEMLFRLLTHEMDVRGLVLDGEVVFERGPVDLTPVAPDSVGDPTAPPLTEPSLAQAVRVDGRPYRLGPGYVSLFDQSGLVSLNAPFPDAVERLLAVLGVPEDRHGPLLATLTDFVDTDDLLSVGGAEAADYARAGLAPPPNAPLRSVGEARLVMGWADQPELWGTPGLPQLAGVARTSALNVNAMPPDLLRLLFALDAEQLEKVLRYRRLHPFFDPENLLAIAGVVRDTSSLPLHMAPSRYLRITTWADGGRLARQADIALTPTSTVAPYQIMARRQVPVPPSNPLDTGDVRLPEIDKTGPAP